MSSLIEFVVVVEIGYVAFFCFFSCAGKVRDFLGKVPRWRARIMEPRRTAVPHGSESQILW